MKIIAALVLITSFHLAVFAQKTPDPEAQNKKAVSVTPGRSSSPGAYQRPTSAEPHRSHSEATSVPKSGASARDLAKIERTSAQQMKTTHRTKAASRPNPATATAAQAQTRSKPMKFSYQPPAAGKTAAAKNSPPVQSRPEKH